MPATYPQAQVIPVVQAAAYAVGSSIGGLMTFQNAADTGAGSALIQGASVTFASGVIPTMDMVLFTSAPAGGTITDRVAVAIATADLGKIVGVLHLADTTLLGAAAPSIVQNNRRGDAVRPDRGHVGLWRADRADCGHAWQHVRLHRVAQRAVGLMA